MAKITAKLERVHAAVVVDKLRKLGKGEELFGDVLAKAAIKAIEGGINSDAWKNYMTLFADNQAQFALLTVPVDGEETWVKEARAYIVSNAVCGGGTDTNVGRNVDIRVDSVKDNVDGSVTRVLEIPDVE